MLELKFIRNNLEIVARGISAKNADADIGALLALDEKRRDLLAMSENLKAERNRANQEIAKAKKGGRPDPALIERMKEISSRIKALDTEVAGLENDIHQRLLAIPNLPHESVPLGASEEDNKEIKRWGEPKEFAYEPRPHWEIGEQLGILDGRRASKLAGSGFALFNGVGALLERALINWMLDVHITKQGYTEVSTPFIVTRDCMVATGQLPKMEEDMYLVEVDDLFLIPTAEVPVTNLHREEILDSSRLPLYYTAYTPCFRREAGSYGKDTRGLIRIHQFDKVEMVKFVKPETSYEELESLLADAEQLLQMLDLHYRVLELCTADLSFASSKCYDIEVWAPGVNRYLEVSSCSNFESFQARRAGIRYRPEQGAKPEYVHTLNGSGLALPRTVAALLETCQNPDGSVTIPEVLRPYMQGMERIGKR